MQDRINGNASGIGSAWPQTVRLYDEDAYLGVCEARILAVMPLSDLINRVENSKPEDRKNPGECRDLRITRESEEHKEPENRLKYDCIRFVVILDRTVFFPEGGGQSADIGTLQSLSKSSEEDDFRFAVHVVDVQQRAGVIFHTVEIYSEQQDRVEQRQDRVEQRQDRVGKNVVPVRQNYSAQRGGYVLPEEESHEPDTAVQKFLTDFQPGSRVLACIDFARRFEFMQNHTGEHILSGLMHSGYGFDNIGFHLSDHTVTLDVNGHLTDEQLAEVERKANEAVWANLPVQVSYPSREELETIPYRSKIEIEGQIRIVTIPGVDICACCAPHVAKTGEIGLIKITRVLRYKGGMRLWILCGGRALKEMQQRQIQIEAVSHLTNRSQDQIADGVQFLLDEIGGLKQQIKELEYQAAFAQLDRIPAGQKNAFLFVGEMDNIVQRNLVNRLVEEHDGICGVFAGEAIDAKESPGAETVSAAGKKKVNPTGTEAGTIESVCKYVCKYKYILGSRHSDTRQLNKVLREKFGAKGGGKSEMVQGSVQASETALREILPAN